jgi:hypothetical protein
LIEIFTDGEESGEILLDYLEKTKVEDIPVLEM